jgi:predicted nucleic acid-binding protein
MRYVDTSVLVAALTRETRTTAMQDWLAAQTPGELAISDWVVAEF